MTHDHEVAQADRVLRWFAVAGLVLGGSELLQAALKEWPLGSWIIRSSRLVPELRWDVLIYAIRAGAELAWQVLLIAGCISLLLKRTWAHRILLAYVGLHLFVIIISSAQALYMLRHTDIADTVRMQALLVAYSFVYTAPEAIFPVLLWLCLRRLNAPRFAHEPGRGFEPILPNESPEGNRE